MFLIAAQQLTNRNNKAFQKKSQKLSTEPSIFYRMCFVAGQLQLNVEPERQCIDELVKYTNGHFI